MKYGTAWSREELILTLYLYCQIPFAKTKANNPEVIRLAQLLGRTPSSVARKLGNFGAFDPLLTRQGISGLTHYSKSDETIWKEFYQRWDSLVEESQRLLVLKKAEEIPLVENTEVEEMPIISQPSGSSERPAVVLVRLHQAFFRRTILSSYETSCCICGIDLPSLLTASHIIPWSRNKELRTDPQNGLCLCALHDKAFDRGLVSISPTLEIAVSARVSISRCEFTRTAITDFANRKIRLPRRFAPKQECLEWHMQNVFLR